MYDSVDLGQIPADAHAVAGYVNGRWPTFPEVRRRWPKARHLSVAVSASAHARCLDVERFDATPAQAPAWIRRQLLAGVHKPVIYCSLVTAAPLLRVLERANISRHAVKLWTAHYTGRPHRCGPQCGLGLGTTADATQWTNRALGRNLDASLCAPDFIPLPLVHRVQHEISAHLFGRI